MKPPISHDDEDADNADTGGGASSGGKRGILKRLLRSGALPNALEDRHEGDDAGGEGGEDGEGGASGKITFHYRDAAQVGPRDDQLSPGEIKRLLAQHQVKVAEHVPNQRDSRREMRDIKQGKRVTAGRRAGYGTGGSSPGGAGANFRAHPLLANRPDGADPKVSSNPQNSEVAGDMNQENRNELQNQLKLTHQYTPGYSPPRLTR